jgi:hypothetical protein
MLLYHMKFYEWGLCIRGCIQLVTYCFQNWASSKLLDHFYAVLAPATATVIRTAYKEGHMIKIVCAEKYYDCIKNASSVNFKFKITVSLNAIFAAKN